MPNVRFKDFSDTRSPLEFAVNGMHYACHEALSIPTTQYIAGLVDGELSEDDILPLLDKFFAAVMDEENATAIHAHLRHVSSPLTSAQAIDIMNWVMEEYGQRPLGKSGDSSDGSPSASDGTPSGDGASPTE